MDAIKRLIRRFDEFQQRNRSLAFPFAVLKKFGDDKAGYLGALIAYYGFFSLFPLLLVFVSVLGIVLRDHPSLQARILDTALGNFPVIGDSIKVNTLSGSPLVLIIGILTALWAGLGATAAAQNAMNEIWDVPVEKRPNFWISRARSLIMLAILGSLTLLTTALTGLGSTSGAIGITFRVVGFAGSFVLNVVLFLIIFKVLTRADVSWGDVMPGAIIAAVIWTGLQALGNYYVTHQVANAEAVYGTFAIVIGLLGWLYLGAQITLYAAEINVVKKRRLWPRALMAPPLTEGDERSYAAKAKAEKRRPGQQVDVSFDEERAEQEEDERQRS
jgi:membrane protein